MDWNADWQFDWKALCSLYVRNGIIAWKFYNHVLAATKNTCSKGIWQAGCGNNRLSYFEITL